MLEKNFPRYFDNFVDFNAATYESAKIYFDLDMEYLDGDDCSLSKVIGVGIKSRTRLGIFDTTNSER